MNKACTISKTFLMPLIYNNALRIISLLFLLAACNSKSDKLPAPQEDHALYGKPKLEYDTSAVAIIRLDSSKHVIGDQAIASATITQEDLSIVDSLMKAYVADHNASLTADRELYRINMDEGNYKIQLVAFVNSEREKEVWVNAFCKVSGDYWKTSPVVVFDGGSCYFQININLTRKEIHSSFVNGVV